MEPRPADTALAALIRGDTVVPDDAALRELAERAAFHGLAPLVATRFREGTLPLPPDTASRVANLAAAARRRCAVLDLEVRRVASRLPPGTATPILAKGPAVARRYRVPALRPYGDIDLLVPEKELDAWTAALIGQGYSPPGEYQARAARLSHHHLVFTRPGPAGTIALELHWRLFAERRARSVHHGSLVTHCHPGPALGGVLIPSLEAQLVILAVHLAHHPPPTRKLMWSLDFVELAGEEPVAEARRLADALGVGWALENALFDVESLLGEARWGARPEVLPPGGLADARARGLTGLGAHAAVARELGRVSGARYLVGRLDPRRFRSEGSAYWSAVRDWIRRNLRHGGTAE